MQYFCSEEVFKNDLSALNALVKIAKELAVTGEVRRSFNKIPVENHIIYSALVTELKGLARSLL